MSITAVIMVIIGLLLTNILIPEIRMTNDNSDYTRAAHIAEAGADLVINEWIDYIKYRNQNDNVPAGGQILASEFEDDWLNTKKESLLNSNFNSSTYYGSGALIQYDFIVKDENGSEIIPTAVYDSCDSDTSLPKEKKILLVNIYGKYDKEEYVYHVKLSYCHHGDIRAYKGE